MTRLRTDLLRRAHAALATAGLFAALTASQATAQSAFCADPNGFCGRTVEASCLSRVGAGSIASDDAECDGQLAAYRDCLALVAAQCGGDDGGGATTGAVTPPSGGQADMMEVWAEIKESDDPDVLEAFAAAYPNGPLATLATKRAAALREEAAAGGQQSGGQPAGGDAQSGGGDIDDGGEVDDGGNGGPSAPTVDPAVTAAAWSAVKASWRIADVEGFLAAYPGSAEAASAQLRAAELRGAYREAQGHLNRLGLSVGSVDGIWGPASERSMARFERTKRLPQTGQLDEQRLASLRAEPTPRTPTPQTPTPQTPSGGDTIQLQTAELRVAIDRLRFPRSNCRTRVQVEDKSLSLREVALECGGAPVKLTLWTTDDGDIRRGQVIYNDFDKLTLNGSRWSYVGRQRARNFGEVEKVTVKVVFVQ